MPRKQAPAQEEKQTRSGSWVQVEGGPILACIDMGTNSFHMIVCQASPERDHFEVITKVKEAVPFFRRSLTAHYIDEVALNSAISILKIMRKKAYEKGADSIVAVATSAVRESRNGAEVLSKIKEELEIDARMISGKEEARLIYLGVLWSMPKLKGSFGIVDIGGGSTEVIMGDRHGITFAESYKLGAARLTQRFFKKGPTQETLRELHDEVRGVLRPAAARLDELGGVQQLIGTSGTVQSLAKIDRVRQGKPGHELHGWRLSQKRLEEIVLLIEESSIKQEKIKGVSSDRSQTILAGAIVLLETMRSLNVSETIVCTAALREGCVVDRFLQTGWLDGGLREHQDPRSASVHQLMDKYHVSYSHAEQVAKIASDIFIQTRGILHEYSSYVGHLLWSAAMLHDIGMFIGRNGHHKHSYYLIKHSGLLGHSEEEVGIIAAIARYHRGSEPKESHEAYYTVSQENRKVLTDMAAILRVAEALDRSHKQVIEKVTVAMQPFQKGGYEKKLLSLIVKLKSGENCYSESWALLEKKEFFESQFQVRLSLQVQAEAGFAVKSKKSG